MNQGDVICSVALFECKAPQASLALRRFACFAKRSFLTVASPTKSSSWLSLRCLLSCRSERTFHSSLSSSSSSDSSSSSSDYGGGSSGGGGASGSW